MQPSSDQWRDYARSLPPVAPAVAPQALPSAKAGWRAAAESALRARPASLRKAHAAALVELVLALASSARRVALYSPIGAETETRDVANALIVRGILLAYPRVRPDGSAMDFAHADGPASLQPRPRSRLMEPVGPIIPPEELDLLVIPCLALSPGLMRLGRGGGYYDRYLPLLGADVATVGVAAAGCVWEWGPAESHDQRLRLACLETGGHRAAA